MRTSKRQTDKSRTQSIVVFNLNDHLSSKEPQILINRTIDVLRLINNS